MKEKLHTGLTAQQVKDKIAQGKINRLPKSRDGGLGEILRRNILTLFNLLNVVLAIILLSIGSYRNVLFMGVVISNALIGTVQEIRAKRTHDRLSLMAEGSFQVWRDGAQVSLPSSELVEGDVVMLTRGQQVPADGLVLEGCAHLNESILTGESEAVEKQKGSTAYSGSFVQDGTLTLQLTAVGQESYMGRLQLSARRVKRAKSGLMRDMNRIIRWVTYAVVPVGLLLFWKQTAVLGLLRNEAIVRSVASVIGMIPEGLILLTSVSLAAGVVKLGRYNAMVNQLFGIETLARTDVLCVDKTGTLTSGAMELEKCICAPGITEEDIRREMGGFFRALGVDGPTSEAIACKYPPVESSGFVSGIPFSSENKWSLALDGSRSIILGAPEKLLAESDLHSAQQLASEGFRVLALMDSPESPQTGAAHALPEDRRLLCLFCLRDRLRPDVEKTVGYFTREGVQLKVISGDSPLTVSCVAKSAGVPDADKCVDLSAISEKDYDALSREYAVFGRVSPEDKRELVLAMQRQGLAVAMVGDGVNDVPALKTADCSLAIGGGSDAACRVSQITLLGDGFDALPEILLEGRRVINNITRASALFLVKNIFSLLVSLVLLFVPFAYPFQPIQLTLVSAVTIGMPSVVLALQPNREKVKGSFLLNIFRRALPGGLCGAVLLLAAMIAGKALHLDDMQISTVCTLVTAFSCYICLLLTCLPLNALRIGLLILVAAILAGAVLLMPGLFCLSPITGSVLHMSLILAALALPIQTGISGLMLLISRARKSRKGTARTEAAA